MSEHATGAGPERTAEIANNVEQFVREVVVPYEADGRRDHHNSPTDELVMEMREKAREAGVLTPHILDDGSHLNQRETAQVLIRTGLSPLGPLACNTMAPDEGNMYLLGKVGNQEIKERFLAPLVSGHARSAFFMTEPAAENGAGSDTRCWHSSWATPGAGKVSSSREPPSSTPCAWPRSVRRRSRQPQTGSWSWTASSGWRLSASSASASASRRGSASRRPSIRAS